MGRHPPDVSTTPPLDDRDGAFDATHYLERLGIDPETVTDPDHATLALLQNAHVTTIPFENLAIVGDPHGTIPQEDDDSHDTNPQAVDDPFPHGPGVTLTIPALFDKLVTRERGGYCFELNGLFATLLGHLGYEVDRIAARVTSSLDVPANHHSIVVTLDQRYVVDVGTGAPMIRQPLPLDGTAVTDEVGVRWRVTPCDRPDEDFQTEYLEPDSDAWETRYVFTDEPRDLPYFEAANDYLQTAPESPFTGDPVIQIATEDGHRRLTSDTLSDPVDGATNRPVDPAEWHDVLERVFGIDPGTL